MADELTETTEPAEPETTPATEPAIADTLIEALDTDGWDWRVQVIRAGRSLNGNEYPLAVLHEAAPLYAGVPVFYGRGTDHNPNERGFDSIAGYITDPAPNESGVAATLEINRGKPDVREAFLHAWRVQQRTGRTPFGLSHVVPRGGALLEAVKPRGYRVKRITAVESVDVVINPAAGGQILAPLSEAATPYVPDALQEAIMGIDQLLARLRAGETLGPDDLARLQEAIGGPALADAISAGAQARTQVQEQPAVAESVTAATPAPAPTPDVSAIEARINEAVAQAERIVRLAECRALLTQRLAESKLPEAMRTAIAADYDGQVFEASDLDARIERDRQIAASLGHVRPHGLGAGVVPGEDQREKHQKALDGLIWGKPIDGVRPFLTLKEAYQQITGDTRFSYIDGSMSRAVLAEAAAWGGHDPLLQEAIDSSTFGEMLGDSITRRMLQEYGRPDRNVWRTIARTVPVTDFREQKRPRWGGFGFLPIVNESGTYQFLTSPTDEEAKDALDKRGGLESLTLEVIANDDMEMVRNIPRKLGWAAIDTLYNEIFVNVIAGNATCSYDSTALYDNTHNNKSTTALGEQGLIAVRKAMRDQVGYGDQTGLPLGEVNTPRVIAVPNELEVTAFKLTQSAVAVVSSENGTTPNFFNNALQVIVVDAWTNDKDWYAFADPQLNPAFEVGFWQGREEPELFVQEAQNVGSVFNADKITYKIRHIWYVMILDHRATYYMDVS